VGFGLPKVPDYCESGPGASTDSYHYYPCCKYLFQAAVTQKAITVAANMGEIYQLVPKRSRALVNVREMT
jgi:hypothetical protein